MTAVRSVDSFKYGTRLFAYLFVVLLVGGGLLGLGAVIIETANTSLANGITEIPDKAELAGGAVLALLGSFVLLSGLFGIVYKLVADSVELGRSGNAAGAVTTAAADDTTDDSDTATTTGPSPGEQAAKAHGSDTTVPRGAVSKPPEQPEPPEQPDGPEQPSPAATDRDQPTPERDTDQPTADEVTAGAEPTADPTASAEEIGPKDLFDDPGTASESDAAGSETATEETVVSQSEPEPGTEPAADTETSRESESDPDLADFGPPEDFEDSEPADEGLPSESGPTADDGTASGASEEDTAERSPPEPSPGEIAFGVGSDSDGDDEGADGDDEEASSAEQAGETTSGDPLADPNDDK